MDVRSFSGRALLLVGLALTAVQCRDVTTPGPEEATPPAGIAPAAPVEATTTATLVGAGDIAICSNDNDEATAKLLDGIPGTVFALGDNAYNTGSATDYANCYTPTWGRHKDRTRPAAGDRDYKTAGAAGFRDYFGAAAGEAGKHYYSYDVGDWHVVVLNSKLSTSVTSAQYKWLQADLAANRTLCTIAYWHKPYVSSASGVRTSLKPIWDLLYANGVEIVLSADNRYYERFAPQTPDLVASPLGIRQFIVGTGGAGKTAVPSTRAANSEVAIAATPGVLKLTLDAAGYSWEFVPVAGKTLNDAGSGTCHDDAAPPAARPGGPYESEGTLTLDGSGSSDPQGDLPLTYEWDFGDGSPRAGGVTPQHTYGSDGVYTVSLVVTDSKGNASAPATTTATIRNFAPTVDAGGDRAMDLGQALTLSAQVSDPNPADGPWNYSISWGDGSSPTTGAIMDLATAVEASHTYAAAGTFAVTVTVTDKDGGQGSDTFNAAVRDPSSGEPYLLIGAGDIAACGDDWWNQRDEETGKLLDQYPDATIFTAGDNAYPNGRAQDYANCYEPAWGRHKHRTWAQLGNHEYDTGTADPTWDYFGDRAGPRGKGYYSFDLGDWHVVVLNDNADFVPFKAGSEQDLWLQADLAASTAKCTIAIFHQPMVMSSDDGFTYRSSRKILWDRLYAAGAEIVLNGHQHFYERFTPMTPAQVRDDATGIRQFIVGTGGDSSKEPTVDIHPMSEVRSDNFGVLKLALYPDRYEWEFLGIPGSTFTDTGTGVCH